MIGAVACPEPITALRVGKVGLDGSGEDAGADKAPVRCHMLKVTWRGAERQTAAVPRADLPAIEIHYEIYDGIPLISKWLVVKNNSTKIVRLNRFTAEELPLRRALPCGRRWNEKPRISQSRSRNGLHLRR